MAYVECDVQVGLRDTDATVKVKDIDQKNVFLGVQKSLLRREGEKNLLAVGVIYADKAGNRVLVELPIESDSGLNRVWVTFDSLMHMI